MTEPYVAANPYPWPYDGDLRPDNTALIIIDMQTDFCGKGGYVDSMGYDLSLTRAPIEPIRALLEALRAQGLSHHPHARGPSARSFRSARQQALALAADRRRHRRPRPVRPHSGARRARLGNHPRAGAARPRADHRQARQRLVLRDRSRVDPAHARHREHHPDRHHDRRLRAHDDARSQRSRLRMPAAGGLLRRHRSRQSSGAIKMVTMQGGVFGAVARSARPSSRPWHDHTVRRRDVPAPRPPRHRSRSTSASASVRSWR